MKKHWFNSFSYITSQIINVVVPLIVYRFLFVQSENLITLADLAVSITVVTALKQIVDWGFTARGVTLLNKGWLKCAERFDQIATIYSARFVVAICIIAAYVFFAESYWEIAFILLSIVNPHVFIHNFLLSHWLNLANILEKGLFLFLVFTYNDSVYELYFFFLFFSQFLSYFLLNMILYRLVEIPNKYQIHTFKAIRRQNYYMSQNILNIVYSNCIVPLLSSFSSTGVILSYFGAEKIIKAVQIVSNACVVSVGPIMKKLDARKFKNLLILTVFIFGVLPMTLVLLGSTTLWKLVYGSSLDIIDVKVLRVISVSLMSSVVFSITTSYFFDDLAGKFNSIVFGTALIVLLVITVLGLSHWVLIWTVFGVELSLMLFGLNRLSSVKEVC